MSNEPKYFTLRDWLLFAILSGLYGVNGFGFTWYALFAAWGAMFVIALLVVIVVYIADKFNDNP